jgi:hypothetical protein
MAIVAILKLQRSSSETTEWPLSPFLNLRLDFVKNRIVIVAIFETSE